MHAASGHQTQRRQRHPSASIHRGLSRPSGRRLIGWRRKRLANVNAFSFRMPRRFLRGHYARLALTVLALACGVAQVTADDLAGRETLRAFVEIIDTVAGRASLQVSAGEGALFPEDVATKIAAVPGVELTVPVVSSTAFMADGSGELLTVQGM